MKLNIDKRSMEIIELFEGDEYKIKKVEVVYGPEIIAAYTFVWNQNPNITENDDWIPEIFERESLHPYLNTIVPEITRMDFR